MGILTDLGVNLKDEEIVKAVEVKTGGLINPGVYTFAVSRAFISKSQGGANKLNIDFEYIGDDGEKHPFFYGTYISSGDEKGNKTTYTDKTGKEKPLPGAIEAANAFKALGVLDPATKKASIEMFNEQVEVLALPELSGKKCVVGIRHMFDDYREKDIAFVDTFLDEKGENSAGDCLLDELKAKIEKSPVKATKKKAPKKETTTEAASGGWN
jgi:hypothetical protein